VFALITDKALIRAGSFQKCIGIYEETMVYLQNGKGMVVSVTGRELLWNTVEKALSKALKFADTQEECRYICERARRHASTRNIERRKRFRDLYKRAKKKLSTLARTG
jgi:hypothetical protein